MVVKLGELYEKVEPLQEKILFLFSSTFTDVLDAISPSRLQSIESLVGAPDDVLAEYE